MACDGVATQFWIIFEQFARSLSHNDDGRERTNGCRSDKTNEFELHLRVYFFFFSCSTFSVSLYIHSFCSVLCWLPSVWMLIMCVRAELDWTIHWNYANGIMRALRGTARPANGSYGWRQNASDEVSITEWVHVLFANLYYIFSKWCELHGKGEKLAQNWRNVMYYALCSHWHLRRIHIWTIESEKGVFFSSSFFCSQRLIIWTLFSIFMASTLFVIAWNLLIGK